MSMIQPEIEALSSELREVAPSPGFAAQANATHRTSATSTATGLTPAILCAHHVTPAAISPHSPASTSFKAMHSALISSTPMSCPCIRPFATVSAT